MIEDTDIVNKVVESQQPPQKTRSKPKAKSKPTTVMLVNTSNLRQKIGHVTVESGESVELSLKDAESPRVQHAIKCGKIRVS